MTKSERDKKSQLTAAIFAGCMVAFLGFGFAATFGVFLAPMSTDLGWGRQTFSAFGGTADADLGVRPAHRRSDCRPLWNGARAGVRSPYVPGSGSRFVA